MVAEAVQQGYCPAALIREELDAGPVRGSARLRGVLAEVTGGIRSVAEADFLALIRRARLPARYSTPGSTPGTRSSRRRTAGSRRVAAEVDSREWHLAPGDWERARWPGTPG